MVLGWKDINELIMQEYFHLIKLPLMWSGVPRLLKRKRRRTIMFYKNSDILASVFTLPVEVLQ